MDVDGDADANPAKKQKRSASRGDAHRSQSRRRDERAQRGRPGRREIGKKMQKKMNRMARSGEADRKTGPKLIRWMNEGKMGRGARNCRRSRCINGFKNQIELSTAAQTMASFATKTDTSHRSSALVEFRTTDVAGNTYYVETGTYWDGKIVVQPAGDGSNEEALAAPCAEPLVALCGDCCGFVYAASAVSLHRLNPRAEGLRGATDPYEWQAVGPLPAGRIIAASRAGPTTRLELRTTLGTYSMADQRTVLLNIDADGAATFAAAADGDVIYCVGGDAGFFYGFDVAAGAWDAWRREECDLPAPRAWGGAAALQGRLVCVGARSSTALGGPAFDDRVFATRSPADKAKYAGQRAVEAEWIKSRRQRLEREAWERAADDAEYEKSLLTTPATPLHTPRRPAPGTPVLTPATTPRLRRLDTPGADGDDEGGVDWGDDDGPSDAASTIDADGAHCAPCAPKD
ncbi:hypothetical protein JL720_11985 [Aureococcus anophagefferens]|nr:hypothetical protein JL720_11985 [Aureococcus anophagefferens]